MKYVLGIGTIFDGITFYGPFDSSEEASEMGKRYSSKYGQDWHIIHINAPSELLPDWLERTFNDGMVP